MKIGILTFHCVDNYGAVLQAYALQTVISLFHDDDVQIIGYEPKYLTAPYNVLLKLDFRQPGLALRTIIANLMYWPHRLIRKRKFIAFRHQALRVIPASLNSLPYLNFEAYIVGSDQVWNTEITGLSDIYFLSFCRQDQLRIAYAASIGREYPAEEQLQHIRTHINNMDFISIRENDAVKTLKDITEKPIYQVLDPTLLLSSQQWLHLCGEAKDNKYILVYNLSGSEQVDKRARDLAVLTRLPVYTISNSHRRHPYGFSKLRNIGPREFLSAFKHAEYIVTDSFHGTAFSIIFEKVFFSVPNDSQGRGNRLRSLAQLLGLESRIIEASHPYTFNERDLFIDYSSPQTILNKEKRKSISFLSEALYGESGNNMNTRFVDEVFRGQN